MYFISDGGPTQVHYYYTVFLVDSNFFGNWFQVEGVEVNNPSLSSLPRGFGFLILVIVIGSALKKLLDLMMR